MGCDIHVYCEAKGYSNDKWINVDHYKKNKYYDPNNDGEYEFEVVHIFDDRDYGLFSILADVRNYADIEPIDQPRGLPDDVTKEVKEFSEGYGFDGHSHSYFTLKELKDYRRSHGVIKHSGYISPKQSEDLDNGITPDSWCQGTSDTTWIHREWEDDMTESLDNLIEALTTRLCEEFWIYKFSRDRKQQIQRNEDRIRIVFWFDN